MPLLTPLTDDEVRHYAQAFGLSHVKTITAIQDGVTNTNYRIDTDSGTYMVRVVNAGQAVAEKTIRLVQHLQAHRFPTPGLLKPETQLQHLEHPVMVFEWIEGQPLDHSPASYRGLGHLLRSLHDIPVPDWLTESCEVGPELLLEIADKVPEPKLHDDLHWAAERLNSYLQGPVRNICHADLFADNLLQDNNDALWLLDWDVACSYSPLFDLGVVAIGCCQPESPDFAKHCVSFLHGYGIVDAESWREATAVAALAWTAWRFRHFEIRSTNPDRLGTYKILWQTANTLREKPV